jgi:PAS domain S-box-containing protein
VREQGEHGGEPSSRLGSLEALGELIGRLGPESVALAEILDSLAEAVTIRSRDGEIVYANRAAVAQMGFSSRDELLRQGTQGILDDYIATDERGNSISISDIPSVRLLAGEPVQPTVLRTVKRTTGEVAWDLLKATLLRDERGEAIAAVTIIEDITTERTAQLREDILTRATGTLMASLDYQETLRNVAWLAVPEVADWCAVDLLDERGYRQQVVVAHRDPQKLELAQQLRSYDSDPPDPERGVGRVIRTGVTELYPDIPDELLVQGAQNERHLELLRQVGLRSVLVAPLRARGRTLGVMTLVTAESMRRFDDSDKEFVEQFASRAAMAVDNARLATARREIAETLQHSLLPEAVPAIHGWDVATMYRPASAFDEVEVGGDFYDFFETPSGWLVLLGDVTGRGVEAASMTSLVRHGARFLAKREHSPSRVLAELDEELRRRPGLSLCSALCVRLERSRTVMSSAGHPPPLLVRDDGRIREIGGSGPLLGGWDGSAWQDRVLEVGPDETLLMYTDGVTDTRGEKERFGAARLRRLLSDHAGATPAELLSALERELHRFQAAGHADDTGAVALRPAESLAVADDLDPGDVVAHLHRTAG